LTSGNAAKVTKCGCRTREVAVLEVGEYEGRPCDLADLAEADGDVLEGAPAPGEQSEATLA
jgi:hypothetical protein